MAMPDRCLAIADAIEPQYRALVMLWAPGVPFGSGS